jgi:SSS family transporter
MLARCRNARVAAAALIALLAVVGTAPVRAQTPSVATLTWSAGPSLPAPRSGQIAGLVGNALIVLGGTDFPISLFDGGPKTWYADGVVLERGATTWAPAPAGLLRRPLAYAAVAADGDRLVVVGGSDGAAHTADAFVLVRRAGRVVREDLPALPVPLAMGAGAVLGRTMVVVGGQTSPVATAASTTLWRLDLDRPALGWREADPLPAPARILPVVVAQAGALHVVSGASLAAGADGVARRTYLTDAWAWRPAAGWRALAAVPRPVVAAPAVPWGQSHVLVLGGDDGALADQVQTLRDRHPGFSRRVLAYHAVTDTWVPMGDLPAGLVTTTAVRDGETVIVPGGEDRPGHRSTTVLRGRLDVTARTFGAVDYAVVAAYLLPLVWIGKRFSRSDDTREDFFLGGRRVPWWAAGLSIYATQLSAITFLAIPAKAYAEDWTYLPGNLTLILVAPIVTAFYLPRFRRLRVTTAYEYLEHRFNLAVRLLCSGAFVALQWARMAIVLYLPALALAAVTGIDIRLSILVMGVLCTVYTLHGGMNAVIWTDVVQSVVLGGAVVLSLVLIVMGTGGSAAEVVRTGYDAGKFRMAIWTPDATIASVWVVVFGNLISHLVPYTADQAVVQRYFTTRDETQASRAVWLGAILAVPSSVVFFAVGTALFAFYRAHPYWLNPASPTDATFAWFIAQQMPVGVSGLVVSGVFAAAMSTLSGSINSIVTAVITDFTARLGPPRPEAAQMRLARALTLVIGLAGTASALVLATWNVRSLWDVFLQSLGLFGGGLAGIFALGIFTQRAHGTGALVGFAASAAVLAIVQQRTPVHFLLYAGIGILSAFVIGYLASLVLPARDGRGVNDGGLVSCSDASDPR